MRTGGDNAPQISSEEALLMVKDLKKYFHVSKRFTMFRSSDTIRAVDGVSFAIRKGETLGLVGESGCGKSTIGRLILRLQTATSGEVWFQGKNLIVLSNREMRSVRSEMQIIFQDPYSSLNPRMIVRNIIGEALVLHQKLRGSELEGRIRELLRDVGLSEASISSYPYEFSGGQRQRIGIARALAVNPKLIVCDEPVSALDVSVQAQVLNLFDDLKIRHDLTYLFISHDLAIVRHISEIVAIMYLGKIVEHTDTESIYKSPLHPYTIALLDSIPHSDPRLRSEFKLIKGELPSPFDVPSGCRFHDRCSRAMKICSEIEPAFKEAEKNHWVACHLY